MIESGSPCQTSKVGAFQSLTKFYFSGVAQVLSMSQQQEAASFDHTAVLLTRLAPLLATNLIHGLVKIHHQMKAVIVRLTPEFGPGAKR